MSGLSNLSLKQDADIKALQSKINNAVVFIENHYTENIYLYNIAQSAHLSHYHFCRLFKKHTGITCNKYLMSFRIKQAKKLLKESDLNITEICFEVGFNNLTHFERVFKGLEGITPSEYRFYEQT